MKTMKSLTVGCSVAIDILKYISAKFLLCKYPALVKNIGVTI
jgi:hypothetical protein